MTLIQSLRQHAKTYGDPLSQTLSSAADAIEARDAEIAQLKEEVTIARESARHYARCTNTETQNAEAAEAEADKLRGALNVALGALTTIRDDLTGEREMEACAECALAHPAVVASFKKPY